MMKLRVVRLKPGANSASVRDALQRGLPPDVPCPQGSLLLSLFGLCLGLARATLLPMDMTPRRMALVLFLTLAMCCASALLAIRKLRQAVPAEPVITARNLSHYYGSGSLRRQILLDISMGGQAREIVPAPRHGRQRQFSQMGHIDKDILAAPSVSCRNG